ncbi:cytochrome b/b6 domain-containing protein [bacterium]|nr:cytochrome b/b6 domain-containing protein [bacterium]
MKRQKSQKAGGVLIVYLLFFMVFGSINIHADEIQKAVYMEIEGSESVAYLVKEINSLEKPYNYLIGTTTFPAIEILGVMAALGALAFGLLHGFGRFLAGRKIPLFLEEVGKDHIYGWITRMGHWLNALTVLGLLGSGFIMHYMGPDHLSGYIHNQLGYFLLTQYILFLIYEIATGDIKQFIPQLWEIKEGILKQALFYAIGIFKREEHPYHMKKDNRLNPLQKPAYFSIMFGLMPVVVLTGFTLLRPDIMGFLIGWIGGLENMKYIFILHLISAFGMLAFLIGHLYLASTGDNVKQHFEVMITGFHRIYKYRLKD